MPVTFDESYPRKSEKGISFHDVGVSSEDILKETEEGFGHPNVVKPEEEENDEPVKEKEESPNEVDNLPFLEDYRRPSNQQHS